MPKDRDWREVGRQPAAWALVFLLGLVLFLAPFFPSTNHFSDQNLYSYLYAVWGLLILLIALIAFCLPKFNGRAGRKSKE